MLAYLNGSYVPRTAAVVPVEDRGFIFGDGVYEVWRIVNGRLFAHQRHFDRLLFGLAELRIPRPDIVDAEELQAFAVRLLDGSGITEGEATLYLQITRGVAPRAHQFPPTGTKPTVYATVNPVKPSDELRAHGATVITVPDIRWGRCDIKTIQLLPNVLAKQAAADNDAIDALLVRDGVVTESSHANAFAVIDGVLRTHPTTHAILPGVTRSVVLDLARALDLPVREEPFSQQDIDRAEELFLTGTTTDVLPIVKVNAKPVASGKPGPIAQRLGAALRAELDAVGQVGG